MDESRLCTIEQIEQFLSASALVAFSPPAGDCERYGHITRVLRRFDYPQRNKRERGVLLATSGTPAATAARKSPGWWPNRPRAAWQRCHLPKRYCAPSVPFARKYKRGDISSLVEMHKAHKSHCSPAIADLLRRAYTVYGDARNQCVAELSSSHQHNLRKRTGY